MDELDYAKDIVNVWLHKKWPDKPTLASILGKDEIETLTSMIAQALQLHK